MTSANRYSLCAAGNQQHRSRPVLRLQEHQQWRKSRVAPERRRPKARIVETFVEYVPRPRQVGSSPDPPSEGVPPPASPLPDRRRQHRRPKCCCLTAAPTSEFLLPCTEKTRLLDAYQIAVDHYATA